MTVISRKVNKTTPLARLLIGLATIMLVIACSGPDSSDDLATETPTTNVTAVSGVPTTAIETATTTAPAAETPSAPTATVPEDQPTSPVGPTATQQPPPNTPTPVPVTPTPVDLGAINLSVEQVGVGFDQPVLVTHAGDGSNRIFVLEKTGYIRFLHGGLYLDISDQVLFYGVRSEEHELGLLGLAFHPDFEENRQFYVHYINRDQEHIISRFTEGNNNQADPDGEEILLTFDQPDINFAGGTILFGPDGYLYIGTGTGTSDNPGQIVAQELDNLYGKILRIDVDNGDPYGIPPDNPFVNTDGARPEIWAYGLRNPWRFAFDPANGDLYIGSPGEFQREWINFQTASTPAGRNYGWPILEGGQCWEFWTGDCTTEGFELPIYSRPTYQDGNCVILGGAVYRGQQSPNLNGVYLFSDYCSGRIWGMARDGTGAWRDRLLFDLDGLVSSFGEDESGELFILAIEDGIVYHIVSN